MANAPPQKNDSAPTPPAPPAKPSATDELKAAQAELAELKAKAELDLVKAQIAKTKAELKQQAARNKAQEEAHLKREKTAKEGSGDDAVAVYRLKEKAYKAETPGSTPKILEAGALVRIPADKLPGASMLAVEAASGDGKKQYVDLKV